MPFNMYGCMALQRLNCGVGREGALACMVIEAGKKKISLAKKDV